MKIKTYIACIALLCFSRTSFATAVSESSAQAIALSFFKLKNSQSPKFNKLAAALKYTKSSEDGTVDFYVFDITPAHGFVIVSADDNVIPILAYSMESYFNVNFYHIGFRRWENKTAGNIELALQHHALADVRINKLWTDYRQGIRPESAKSMTANPLCSTTWDQENDFSNPPPFLYNLYCPWNSADQQRCLTGCVATAQAQVMKYWNYPTTGTGSFSYDDVVDSGYSYNYGIQSSDFAAHTYQWALMPSILTGAEPPAQDTAVDILMYDCAVSIGMDFGDDNQDGSGANALIQEEIQYGDSFCSQYALPKYFGYNPDSLKGIFEDHYTSNEWIALIEHEINVSRPVIYEGNDTAQGGHAWVCDGYDADNNLHMNWGWSGFDNGYFAINNLTTAGNFDPILEDDALIGILPKYPIAPVPAFQASFTGGCSRTVQFTDLSQDLPSSWLWNFGDDSTSTLQNPVHTYAVPGTYSVTLTVTNPAGSTPVTYNNYIIINMLPAPSVSNITADTPGTFSLHCSTSNTVEWFNASGALVSTANPFVTPYLDNTTTYYVEDSFIGPSYPVGPPTDTMGYSPGFTDPYAMIFSVLKPCILESVYVYAHSAANRTIQVLDSMGKIIAQQTVFCPTGGSRATLNFHLNAGGPYFMSLADTMGLSSDSSGTHYPYTDSAGILKITGNTIYDNDFYFYFYNWLAKEPDCTSPRVPVTVNIETGISPVIPDFTFTLLPNPANNEVLIKTAQVATGLILSIKNILGQTLYSKPITGTQTSIDLSAYSSGIYLVELRAGAQAEIRKLVINR